MLEYTIYAACFEDFGLKTLLCLNINAKVEISHGLQRYRTKCNA